MGRAAKELLDLSNLDDEQLQIAVRVAHNDLKDRKDNFDEFVREGAHARIILYSYLHFLFAQVIVLALNEESDRRNQRHGSRGQAGRSGGLRSPKAQLSS